MSASLVGSEMCIRDSPGPVGARRPKSAEGGGRGGLAGATRGEAGKAGPVSYTHLTLPTICSV
eukprot:4884092-Alexandrium_andersonii.AAC.1